MFSKRRVVVVGAGAVGSTYAYTLMRSGLAGEIVLVDIDRDRAEGEALDMNHGLFFSPPVNLHAGDYDDCRNADLIVITAGAAQKPGQSRLDLISTNVKICRDIMEKITAQTTDPVILMVTNPVDVLTYFAREFSGLPAGRVIGSGTVLDSARFRYLLSRYFNIDARNVHSYVIGEHGDSEVCLWSSAHIGAMPLDCYCKSCNQHIPDKDRTEIEEQVRQSAYHIIESKGATNYAVSLALERITGAILRNERSVLTVSTLNHGEYGLEDVCLSLPCVVDSNGVAQVLCMDLDKKEEENLQHSARVLKNAISQVKEKAPA